MWLESDLTADNKGNILPEMMIEPKQNLLVSIPRKIISIDAYK